LSGFGLLLIGFRSMWGEIFVPISKHLKNPKQFTFALVLQNHSKCESAITHRNQEQII